MNTSPATTPGAPSRSPLRRVGWRLERRLDVKPWHEVVTLAGAFAVGLAICSILIAASDKSVVDSYRALFDGAFGSRRATYETLVQATPLIFTASRPPSPSGPRSGTSEARDSSSPARWGRSS